MSESFESAKDVAAQCVVRQLVFLEGDREVHIATALGYKFIVRPRYSEIGWVWSVFDMTDFNTPNGMCAGWQNCDTKEQAFVRCNQEWRKFLKPYLEV